MLGAYKGDETREKAAGEGIEGVLIETPAC